MNYLTVQDSTDEQRHVEHSSRASSLIAGLATTMVARKATMTMMNCMLKVVDGLFDKNWTSVGGGADGGCKIISSLQPWASRLFL